MNILTTEENKMFSISVELDREDTFNTLEEALLDEYWDKFEGTDKEREEKIKKFIEDNKLVDVAKERFDESDRYVCKALDCLYEGLYECIDPYFIIEEAIATLAPEWEQEERESEIFMEAIGFNKYLEEKKNV
jgi:hypothetical protein